MTLHDQKTRVHTADRDACVGELLALAVLPARGTLAGRPAVIEAVWYTPHSVGFWVNDGRVVRCRLTEAQFDDPEIESARARAAAKIQQQHPVLPIANLDALQRDADHLCELLWHAMTHLRSLVDAAAGVEALVDAMHNACCGIELLDGMGHLSEASQHAHALVDIGADAYRLHPVAELANALSAAAAITVSADRVRHWPSVSADRLSPMLTRFEALGVLPHLLGPASPFLSAVLAQYAHALAVWREALARHDASTGAACALDLISAGTPRQLTDTLHAYHANTVGEAARTLHFHASPATIQRLKDTLQRVEQSDERAALIRGLFGDDTPADPENALRAAALANPTGVPLLEWAEHVGSAFLDDASLRPSLDTLYVLCMRQPGYAHLLGTLVESLSLDDIAAHSSWTLQDLAPFLLRQREIDAAITTYAALALRHANRGKPRYYGLGVEAIADALTVGELHDRFDLADCLVSDVLERHAAKYAFHGPGKLALARAYRRIGIA